MWIKIDTEYISLDQFFGFTVIENKRGGFDIRATHKWFRDTRTIAHFKERLDAQAFRDRLARIHRDWLAQIRRDRMARIFGIVIGAKTEG